MKTKSYWLENYPRPALLSLTKNLHVDVLVIGGGITGLTTALLLRETGRRVAVVEKNFIGAGDTGHTTAHITYMTDTRLSDLVKTFGENHAIASWQAGHSAMAQVEALVQQHEIACEWRTVPGFLAMAVEAPDPEKERTRLEHEASVASKHGFDVSMGEHLPLGGRPGMRFGNQLKFHPIKYLQGLCHAAFRAGVEIYERAEVAAFKTGPNRAAVAGHEISYDHLVVATHMPLQGNSGTLGALMFQTKLYAYSTYALQAELPAGTLPEMIWSDTAEPFRYVRLDRREGRDILVLGGEDHKTGQVTDTEACYSRLRQVLANIAPKAIVQHHWSGQVIETPDGLPYIGDVGDNQFLATGFSGNGMTFGTLAAIMARDSIEGAENPWKELFSPGRKKLRSTWDYLKENRDYPYYLAKSWMTSVTSDKSDAIPLGKGAVLRSHGKRIAAYRDGDGHLHKVSAVCPHLGCIVKWNDAESTWDCPCHGSRFSGEGELIAGPAEKRLDRV